MKIFSKLLLLIIMLLLLFAGLIYAVNNGKFNNALRHVTQYILSQNGIDTDLENFQFKDGIITSDEVKLKFASNLATIKHLKINLDLKKSFTNSYLLFKIDPTNITIWDQNNDKFLELKISGQFSNHKDYNINLDDIKISGALDINNKNLEIGKASLNYKAEGNSDIFDCSLNFGTSTKFKMKNLEDTPDQIKIEASNIPILLYKQAIKLSPNNGLLVFLEKFVRNGHIQDGTILWSPNNSDIDKKLSGLVSIRNLDFDYDKEFPTLKNISLDLELKGNNSTYRINSGHSSDILLSGGQISMEWKGLNDTCLNLKTKGHGPAKSLIDFIPEKKHKSMAKANIDLKKITGNVDIDVNIKIPLKPRSKNIYNITANLPDSSLDLFKGNAALKSAKISGKFDGSKVTLNGSGKINNFDSDLNFIYNIEDESKFNHKLNIKTYFKTPKKQNTKIGFATILKGDSTIDLQYINKDSKGLISVNSNITGLDLYFDKLGIRKRKNTPAKLAVNGTFDDPTNGIFDFAITGDNQLNITGGIAINDDSTEINVKQIVARKTDLSAKLTLKNKLLTMDLEGKELDLSNADMMQFLEKERDSEATKINFKIDKVRLKNNIILKNLAIKLECDENRCFSGYVNSKLGNKFIEMLLSAEGKTEQWLIKCSNAGALLQGIGAYDTMKSGMLTININTSRKETRPGEIIPIFDGTFLFERFVLSDTPVMSRIISIASLPGILNAIQGNKDIKFSTMNGKFSFTKNILRITESSAEGPYFDFNLKGKINTKRRLLDLEGFATPHFYGISSVVGSIPLIGDIFSGTKKRRGIISGAYQIKEGY